MGPTSLWQPTGSSGPLHVLLSLPQALGLLSEDSLWLPLTLLANALLPDLGLLNLTPRHAIKAFGLLWAKGLPRQGGHLFQWLSCEMSFQLVCHTTDVMYIHSVNKYWFSTYCVLGSVLEAGHVVSAFLELSSCWDPEDRAGLLIKKKREKTKQNR